MSRKLPEVYWDYVLQHYCDLQIRPKHLNKTAVWRFFSLNGHLDISKVDFQVLLQTGVWPFHGKDTHFCRNISCEIMIKLIIMPWINDQWYILKYLSHLQSQWINITLLRVYSLSLSLARTHAQALSLSLSLSHALSLSLPLSLYCIHSNKQTNLTCNPLIQFKKSYFKLIKQKQKLQLVTVH